MTEILHAYETVVLHKAEYCILCLRTSKERRLVEPKCLEKIMECIDQPFPYIQKYQKLCYVCDRQANVVLRFHRALTLTDKLHTMFQTMVKSRKLTDQFYIQIHGFQSKNKKPPPEPLGRLPEWEKELSSFRASTALLQTEVLMLNTGTDQQRPPQPTPLPPHQPHPPSPLTNNTSTSRAPETQVPKLIRNDDGVTIGLTNNDPVEQNVLSEPEIFMDAVVILDEDDPIEVPKEERPDSPLLIPDSPPTSSPPPDSILPDLPTRRNLRVRPDLTNNTVNLQNAFNLPLNTLSLTNTLNLQNNSLNLQNNSLNLQNNTLNLQNNSLNLQNNSLNLQNNSLTLPNTTQNLLSNTLYIPGNTQNLQHLFNSQMLLQNNGSTTKPNYILRPFVQNNAHAQLQIMNGQLVLIDNSNLIVSTPQLAVQNGSKMELIIDPNKLTNPRANQNSKQDTNKDDEVQIVPTTIDQNETGKRREDKKREIRKERKRQEEEKQNVEETVGRKETDWEDKIPMDVISFMDATDPNAEEVLRTKGPVKPLSNNNMMGVITDVRSISEPGPRAEAPGVGPGAPCHTRTENFAVTGVQSGNFTTYGKNATASGVRKRIVPIVPAPGTQHVATLGSRAKVPRIVLPKLSISDLLDNATLKGVQIPNSVSNKGPDKVRESETGSVYSWGKSVHIVKKK